MARRPTTTEPEFSGVSLPGGDNFANIVQAAIAPVNTDGALEQIARKAFNNGLKRVNVTFEGALAEVLKEGIRLERVATAQAEPPARGRGRPKGSMGVAKADTNGTGNLGRGYEAERQEPDAARNSVLG